MKPLNLTFDAKSSNLRQLLVLFVITICIVLSRKTAPAAEPGASNAGTGQAQLERYSIVACVLELNANWIAGLKQYPSGKNWELFGQQLCEVFFHYFDSKLWELESKS